MTTLSTPLCLRCSRAFGCAALLVVALACLTCTDSRIARHEPEWILWVWERPEDLSFVDPDRFEVAVLRSTITVSGAQVRIAARAQPLRLPKGIERLAVVRVESDHDPARQPPSLSADQLDAVTEAALASVGGDDLGLQIDFDATTREREFYRGLLARLRSRLPEDKKLSVAGLASWCDGDRWIGETAADEIVPMLYRMGPDGDGIRRRLSEGRPFAEPRCRQALGLSSDEAIPTLNLLNPTHQNDRPDRIYLFHSQPWTRSALDALLGRLNGIDRVGRVGRVDRIERVERVRRVGRVHFEGSS